MSNLIFFDLNLIDEISETVNTLTGDDMYQQLNALKHYLIDAGYSLSEIDSIMDSDIKSGINPLAIFPKELILSE